MNYCLLKLLELIIWLEYANPEIEKADHLDCDEF